MPRLSVELNRYFFQEDRPPRVEFAALWDLAGERIFGFLFVLLALPSALPVPAPGYSTPFGIVMFLLALQLIRGAERPWLPESWMARSIQLDKLQGFLKAGLPWLEKIEVISRPRLTYVCTSSIGRTTIGIAIALMSISMMIPIPGTNTLPAIGIFVVGFGLLDDDGAISLAGLVVCAIGLIVSASVLAAVWIGGTSLVDWIKLQLERG
ncbi:MAG: exopolysaccharide biosynthesis protein [Cyanobacteriota bacterium]|nr:exopolysaccharide biosynthesis protein [Cyanobacteriota bacterium]